MTRDPVKAYARAVLAGDEPAGALVRLACQRHLTDLEQADAKGLRWRLDKALDAIRFFDEVLKLPDVRGVADDERETQAIPFTLQPWQRFVVGSLFGWYRSDGQRRFRVGYLETSKGSGKTPLVVGSGLYTLVAVGGHGAQIYTAASTLEQARVAFRDAENMVAASPDLAAIIDRKTSNLAVLETNSFLRPISAEKRALDGKRVSLAIADELHEHRDSTVVDKLRAGTKGRPNALILEPTNAGCDRQSVCWEHHEYSRRVLEGTLTNDSWFAYIAHLDACAEHQEAGHVQPVNSCEQCDRWDVEGEHWRKANPSLGVTISWDYLREQVREAVGMPAKRDIVRRLNFSIWTEARASVITSTAWNACAAPIDWRSYEGRRAFVGVDLASTQDIAAVAWVFPEDEDESRFSAMVRLYVPEDVVGERTAKGLPYRRWVEEGALIATSGGVIDYERIRADLNDDADRFTAAQVGYDPWNAAGLAAQLTADGFTCVEVRQGFRSLSEPTKRFLALVSTGALRHDGNACLAWMASNLTIAQDAAGNMKPDKSTRAAKIDGPVAIIIAMSRAIVTPVANEEEFVSIYERRGLTAIGG
jgi:phage terminase large subunit-like protein